MMELCQLLEDGSRQCVALQDGVLFMGDTFSGGTTADGYVPVMAAFFMGLGLAFLKRVLLDGS